MKISLPILLVMFMGLSGCSSQKKLEASTPFTIGECTSQEWVGGREESGKGRTIEVAVSNLNDREIEFKNVFFRGEVAEVSSTQKDGAPMVVAKFDGQKKDIIMHDDATKEVGNQPPKLKTQTEKDFPFELQKDEAVLSYTEKGKMKFVKISGIKEKKPIVYPSRPKN